MYHNPLFAITLPPALAGLGPQEWVIVGLIIGIGFAIHHHFMRRAPRKTTRILFLIWLAGMAAATCVLYIVLRP